jgi:hypothetical protein
MRSRRYHGHCWGSLGGKHRRGGIPSVIRPWQLHCIGFVCSNTSAPVAHDTTPLHSCISGSGHFNSVYADCHDYQNGGRPEQLSLLGYLVNSCSDAPAPPPAPLPPAPTPSQYLVSTTAYRKRAAGTSLDLANGNAASVLGTTFFMLVDMAGANQTTPLGEANPLSSLLTQFQVQCDLRTTGYASCYAPGGGFSTIPLPLHSRRGSSIEA